MGLVFGWLARRLGWVRDVDFGAREGVAGTIRKGGGSHQFIWVSFLTLIFHLIFEILKIHASPTLILPRQKFIHFSKNQPPPQNPTSTQQDKKYLFNHFQYSLLAPLPIFHEYHRWCHPWVTLFGTRFWGSTIVALGQGWG